MVQASTQPQDEPHFGSAPRVGIHGLGRIGRSIYRQSLATPTIDVVAINDNHPDDANLAYLTRFDSMYGRLPVELICRDGIWRAAGREAVRSCSSRIEDVPWSTSGVEVVIDSSGSTGTPDAYSEVVRSSGATVLVTTRCTNADFTLVPGVNENAFKPDVHRIVQTTTCDAMALALVLHPLEQAYTFSGGFVTTLHPWLGYQPLLDAPLDSRSPADYRNVYELGRAAPQSLIPKPTSATNALDDVLPGWGRRLRSMSYRTPMQSVSMAEIFLMSSDVIDARKVNELLSQAAEASGGALQINEDALVSVDFVGEQTGAIFDARWTEVADDNLLRLVVWYDNVAGYASQVVRAVKAIASTRAAQAPLKK